MPFTLKSLQVMPAGNYLAMMSDEAAKITYSQMGEDIIVQHLLTRVFHKMDRGFYVDVGAFHPRLFSNTKFLHMVGWRGLNIDASKEAIMRFDLERPGDINVCCGVAPTEGEATFYEFEGGAASTISSEQARIWQGNLGWKLIGESNIRVRPLNSLLEEFLPAGQTIDYLNVDLEGLDGDVIRSLDLSRYRPMVLTIELHDVDKVALAQNEAVSYVISHGYTLQSVNLVTLVFSDGMQSSNVPRAN